MADRETQSGNAPQYQAPEYPVESPTPIHDLLSLPAEGIATKAVKQFTQEGYFYFPGYAKAATDEDFNGFYSPEEWAEMRAGNQWRWELSMLSQQDPEKGLATIEEFKKIGGTVFAAHIVPGIFSHDVKTAWELTDEFLYSDDGDTPDEMENAIAAAMENNQLDPAISAQLFRLANHRARDDFNTKKRLIEDNARLKAELDGSHAQVAASRAGVQIVADTIHLRNTTFGDGITKTFYESHEKSQPGEDQQKPQHDWNDWRDNP